MWCLAKSATTCQRDETCPISTEGWTRRVHFVREGGDVVLGKERDDLAPPDDPTLHHAIGLAAVDETCPLSTGGRTRRVQLV